MCLLNGTTGSGTFVSLDLGERLLMGSDSPPEYFEIPQGFYVQISVDPPTEAERIFYALAENGKIKMPIEQTFWSARFGMLVAHFGTPWMINCEQTAWTFVIFLKLQYFSLIVHLQQPHKEKP